MLNLLDLLISTDLSHSTCYNPKTYNRNVCYRKKKKLSVVNQSGIEPLNLENGSSVGSGNFDATDLRFQSVELKLKPTGIR